MSSDERGSVYYHPVARRYRGYLCRLATVLEALIAYSVSLRCVSVCRRLCRGSWTNKVVLDLVVAVVTVLLLSPSIEEIRCMDSRTSKDMRRFV